MTWHMWIGTLLLLTGGMLLATGCISVVLFLSFFLVNSAMCFIVSAVLSPQRYLAPPPVSATKMLYVGGNTLSYSCEVCGSNCFHHPRADDENKYECNGCGTWYSSGKDVA